jgi:hypothetical protein
MKFGVPAQRLAAPAPVSVDDLVRRAVWLGRLSPNQSVSVAGPDGLEAMLALCRAGFDQVVYGRGGFLEAGDALLIAGPMRRGDLAAALAASSRVLRHGGVLVAQLAHPADDTVVREALTAQGLAITGSRFDVALGWLVGHRLERRVPHPAAR